MAVGSYDRQAMEYANGRPQYPPQLFSFIANHVPHRRLAWDVGTGSGQAALALSEIFERVIATDVSEQQISYAPRRPNITYAVTPRAMSLEELESSVGAEGSVDLVTVAQALHWLDLDTFYGHVKHVLRKPGGVFAAWCYREPVVNPSVDCVFEEVFRASVAFWDPPRRMVDEGYATVCFPFRGVVQEGSEGESTTAPVKFWAKKEMGLEAYLNYMRSWHAYQKAKATGVDLLDEKTIALFKDAWGESDNDAKTKDADADELPVDADADELPVYADADELPVCNIDRTLALRSDTFSPDAPDTFSPDAPTLFLEAASIRVLNYPPFGQNLFTYSFRDFYVKFTKHLVEMF